MPPADRRYRVLIVDDEDGVRTFVERVLGEAGYELAVAEDASRALEVAAAAPEPFDLLLSDLVMPGMNGDELARLLRQQQPDLKILYLTGYSDRLFSTRQILWDNESFVDKPVTARGLRQAVSLAIFGHTRGPA